VLSDRFHRPFDVPQWGKKAAHNQFRSAQRSIQAVSAPQNSLPRVALQTPGIMGFISVSSLTQFPICQRNKSKSQVNLASCRLTNPTYACCSLKTNAARSYRPLYPNRLVWKHVLHETVASVYCNTDELIATNTVGKETSTF